MLSLGGMFELYDLFMTAYVVPGLVKAGLLTNVTAVGIFAGPALFVAATFTGLFIGTFVFGYSPTNTDGGRSSPTRCCGTAQRRW